MNLIKHSCPSCNFDLEIPERIERVCCPRCGSHLQIEIFENVVILKKIREEQNSLGLDTDPFELLHDDINENIEVLDKKIKFLNRQLIQRRTAGFSSLSVSTLFFFFSLVWLLAERNLIALFCGIIAVTMVVVAGNCFRDSARARSSLTLMISRRDQLDKRMRPNMPRIY
jgi:hypothetical protein